MKIAIITDAWYPQTNGVVTTLNSTGECLKKMGQEVLFINPQSFKSIPLPTYKSIRLALFAKRRVFAMLDEFSPDAIHIATEGPLGMVARKYCQRRKLKFTTAYHTQFPYYVRLRAPIPLSLSYAILRRFHSGGATYHGANGIPAPGIIKVGFQECGDLVAWCGCGFIQATRQGIHSG